MSAPQPFQLGHYTVHFSVDLGSKCNKFGLSPREKQALFYLAIGHTGREACEIMGISIGTMDTYKKRIFQKLGVNTVAEAVALNIAHLSGAPVTYVKAA